MKIANGVEMLEISGTVLSQPYQIYPTLMVDGNTILLVDTGYPGQHAKIREAVEKAGVPFENLNQVILTHQDIDHIGGLSAILKDAPRRIEVLSHQEERAFIQGDQQPHKLAQLADHLEAKPVEIQSIYEKMKLAYQTSYVHVDRTVSDGQELPYLGGVVVIHTPGHTLGHICLYLKKSKILIAGDALEVEEGRLVPTPPSINYDLGLYKQSLKKLAGYDIQSVICYHGGLYQDQPFERIADLAKDDDSAT